MQKENNLFHSFATGALFTLGAAVMLGVIWVAYPFLEEYFTPQTSSSIASEPKLGKRFDRSAATSFEESQVEQPREEKKIDLTPPSQAVPAPPISHVREPEDRRPKIDDRRPKILVPNESERVWRSLGGHETSATLLTVNELKNWVQLLKSDGTIVRVAIDKLSQVDAEYCVSMIQRAIPGDVFYDASVLVGFDQESAESLAVLHSAINRGALRIRKILDSQASDFEKKKEYTSAKYEFLASVKGLPLSVHFLVEGVERGPLFGKKQQVSVLLSSPELPVDFQSADPLLGKSVKVILPFRESEVIGVGDLVRLKGKINESSDMTIQNIRFKYALPNVNVNAERLFGDFQAEDVPDESEKANVAVFFNVTKFSRLNNSERQEFLESYRKLPVSP